MKKGLFGVLVSAVTAFLLPASLHAWTTPIYISGSDIDCSVPKVARGASGGTHYVYRSKTGYWHVLCCYRFANGTWTPLETISQSGVWSAVTVFVKAANANSAASNYHNCDFDDCAHGQTGSDKTIIQAKSLPDGTPVTVSEGIITAVFNGFFYIERPDRSAGIRVQSSASVNVGDAVTVSGCMSTISGERYIVGEKIMVR